MSGLPQARCRTVRRDRDVTAHPDDFGVATHAVVFVVAREAAPVLAAHAAGIAARESLTAYDCALKVQNDRGVGFLLAKSARSRADHS